MLVEILLLFTIVLLLYQRWTKRDVYELGKQLNSGVWTIPIIGHSYLFLGDSHTRMKAFQILGRDAIGKENGLSSLWHGNYLYTMVADPAAAELVLKTCLEKDDIMRMAKLFVGNGSIFAPVSIWRPRRKVLAPTFSMKNLKFFVTIFARESAVLAHKLGSMVGTGSLPAFKYFTAYTMDAIADSTLGYKMGAQNDTNQPFLIAFDHGLARVGERLCQPWLHSDIVYTNLPLYSRLLKEKDFLWNFVTELINAKRKGIRDNKATQESKKDSRDPSDLQTLLECLIKSSGGDEGYTDIEIMEELMVIMIAGNDTSAVGASFISVLLSRHPEVQEKAYEELVEVFGESNRPATFEDLSRLKYLDAVIRETLRLYPPVPVIVRKIDKDVQLPTGIKLVPDTGVVVNIWALHRNPRYWGGDAELFRPERFIDTPLTHPAAFMPFSHGPRNCVGYQYAIMSLKTALSTVLRRYRILPATEPNNDGSEHPPLRLTFDLMMKDKDNFQIRIEPRI